MDFGSKYVYKYDHSSDESVSDDEDLVPASSTLPIVALPQPSEATDGGVIAETPASSNASVVVPKEITKRKKRLRKADTNVLSVKFDRLLQPGEMHAGDPVYCSECGAIASHLSKIETQENTDSKWQCEFCPKLNTVDIEQTDLPKKEDATYLLVPAPVVHGSDMSGVDNSIIIFVVDISGSMSSTTLVQGAVDLPNAAKQRQRDAANFDGERMIRQRHQTYISRLQGVQMAVDANLEKLTKDTPTRRAALLTFNHEIVYYGDGTRDEPLVIRGDKLDSTEELLREVERENERELKPVSETKKRLTERVYDLEEGGQTALGPAIFFALNIASKRQGSRIVICTDGLANRGLGNLEMAQDGNVTDEIREQALTTGNGFYADVTERARESGVSISVITIKGTTCLLPVIGQMADGTGGNVTIVDLLNIRDEFATILEQKIIATNVEATLIVHRGLYIRNPNNPEEKLDKIKNTIGNVTKQTEVSFEFGVHNKAEIKEKYNIDLDEVNQLPFQVQVTYTDGDGNKALRVLTQLKQTTADRSIAELNAYRSVIAENHIRTTANRMMLDIEDDDDEVYESSKRTTSKWSKPIMQKQRMHYMDNLKYRKTIERSEVVDDFNERRWDKASHDMNSYVVSSKKARRNVALKPSSVISSRDSNEAHGTPAMQTGALGLKKPSSEINRRYGCATPNVQFFTDKSSEEIYRYKNITSSFLRSSSPVKDDESPAEATNTGVVAIKDDENDKDRINTKKADADDDSDNDSAS